jgi:UDP-galactose transporter B1
LTAGAVTGELAPAIKFCVEYPMVLRDIFILGVTSALGQNFIYYTIHEFGSLNCSIMTTSRKFFTILCSVAWFGHSMTTKQWGGVGMVFTGLACDLYSSKKARDAKKKAV